MKPALEPNLVIDHRGAILCVAIAREQIIAASGLSIYPLRMPELGERTDFRKEVGSENKHTWPQDGSTVVDRTLLELYPPITQSYQD